MPFGEVLISGHPTSPDITGDMQGHVSGWEHQGLARGCKAGGAVQHQGGRHHVLRASAAEESSKQNCCCEVSFIPRRPFAFAERRWHMSALGTLLGGEVEAEVCCGFSLNSSY